MMVETLVPQPAAPYLVPAECLPLRLNQVLAGQKYKQEWRHCVGDKTAKAPCCKNKDATQVERK